MSAPIVKGWCPGALRPMLSGDGLLVRIRPRLGRLTAHQARGVAQASARHGTGVMALTNRANLQLRGVRPAALDGLQGDLKELGLLDADPVTEAKRNIVIGPFWTRGDVTQLIATALETELVSRKDLSLPGKFGFAIDCGPTPVLRDTSADIRIERSGEGALICRPDGCSMGIEVTSETAANAAIALAEWFLASGGASNGRGRMREVDMTTHPLPSGYVHAGAPRSEVDFPPERLIGFEFGEVTAHDLTQLAEFGDMRLTPWRMLLLERSVPDALRMDGWLRPDDRRLGVSACTGLPGCAQGHAEVRPLARLLGAKLERGENLHVSGCPKGCAHPGPAAVTLVAEPGGTFSLIRSGPASDAPIRSGLTVAQILANPTSVLKGP